MTVPSLRQGKGNGASAFGVKLAIGHCDHICIAGCIRQWQSGGRIDAIILEGK